MGQLNEFDKRGASGRNAVMHSGRFPLAVAAMLLGATAAGQPVTVALDLRGLDASTFRRLDGVGLESRAVLRLVQEGFAVVALDALPTLTLRITANATEVTLSLDDEVRIVPIGDKATRELHFELAQKLVGLAREKRRPPALDAGTTAAPTPVDAGLPLPPPIPRPVGAEASIGATGLIRGPGVDPRAHLDVWLPLGEAFAIDLMVAISISGDAAISVVEPELLAGVGYRFRLSNAWSIEPRVLVGASLHVYSLNDPTAVDLNGSRADFLLLVPVTVSWNPIGRLLVALQVAPGVSSRTREHLRRGVSLWKREALRFGFGATVGWRF